MNLDDAMAEGINFLDRNVSDEGRYVEAREGSKKVEERIKERRQPEKNKQQK